MIKHLRQLNDAARAQDMNMPGRGLHSLSGDLAEHWSITKTITE